MANIHWHSVFFLVFAAIACGGAIAVTLSSHIVRMAFYLVLSLSATAGLFFLAGADFVGAAQIMIYVGATLVLLVFGVMLTAQGPFVSMKARGGEWVASLVAAGALLVILLQATLGVARWWPAADRPMSQDASPPTAARLGLGLLGARVDQLTPVDAARSPSSAAGSRLPARDTRGMSGYLLPFEIISVHLLVVLIGAAYLARPKRRAGPIGLQPGDREAR